MPASRGDRDLPAAPAFGAGAQHDSGDSSRPTDRTRRRRTDHARHNPIADAAYARAIGASRAQNRRAFAVRVENDAAVSFNDRWSARSESDTSAEAAIKLLRRGADYIQSLGPVVVREMVLAREADGLTLTAWFDRSRMRVDLDYLDPRMAAQFDDGDGERDDFDFVIALAAELDAATIIDLGCGTGRLATLLAGRGHRVIGVDPAPAMLDVARCRDGASEVDWVLGDAGAIGVRDADLVVMTGNIALAIVEDDAWDAALRAIQAALRPGGYLVFSSMNPSVRPWEAWNTGGMELISVRGDRVRVDGHVTLDGGEVIVAGSEYRFRVLDQLAESLTNAGFHVERTYGDWQSSPLTPDSRDIVIVARKRGEPPSGT